MIYLVKYDVVNQHEVDMPEWAKKPGQPYLKKERKLDCQSFNTLKEAKKCKSALIQLNKISDFLPDVWIENIEIYKKVKS